MGDRVNAGAVGAGDKDALKVTFDRVPEREELDPEIKEQLVIEYYSK